ncbi:hypothetical protein LJC32_02250 [Oscillospiraceae bacterium OttesenSCG-928-F05]|nr:hypothetical protein [Oscillospiraceae bacterium OttesenSCG-928-F05]
MENNAQVILFGAGLIGQKALHYYGRDRVFCFVDNKKCGSTFFGKRVISFEELKKIYENYRVILSVVYENAEFLKTQCSEHGIKAELWLDVISYDAFPLDAGLRQFEKKHRGHRCFLIGNGPSLREQDLEKLFENGDLSFGCNHIKNIYDKTHWRPNYLMASDPYLIAEHIEKIASTQADAKFLPYLDQIFENSKAAEATMKKGGGEVYYFDSIHRPSRPAEIQFSDNPAKALYDSTTVMYLMLQMAVYMGFSQIYLLGVDNSPPPLNGAPNSQNPSAHFYADKKGEAERSANKFASFVSGAAASLTEHSYREAERYSRAHGCRIYNATRGGLLEIFERVEFDTLF